MILSCRNATLTFPILVVMFASVYNAAKICQCVYFSSNFLPSKVNEFVISYSVLLIFSFKHFIYLFVFINRISLSSDRLRQVRTLWPCMKQLQQLLYVQETAMLWMWHVTKCLGVCDTQIYLYYIFLCMGKHIHVILWARLVSLLDLLSLCEYFC